MAIEYGTMTEVKLMPYKNGKPGHWSIVKITREGGEMLNGKSWSDCSPYQGQRVSYEIEKEEEYQGRKQFVFRHIGVVSAGQTAQPSGPRAYVENHGGAPAAKKDPMSRDEIKAEIINLVNKL